jgi:hypothetical protein
MPQLIEITRAAPRSTPNSYWLVSNLGASPRGGKGAGGGGTEDARGAKDKDCSAHHDLLSLSVAKKGKLYIDVLKLRMIAC